MTTSSSNDKPSLHWRKNLRTAFPRGPNDEQAFYEYCVPIYAEERRFLDDALARGASDKQISGARMGVYLVALVLLTYGRLDVIGDVLENMLPRPHPTNRALSYAVNALIPIPANVRAGDSPLEALAWIRAHESRLRWDEDAGRFVLDEA